MSPRSPVEIESWGNMVPLAPRVERVEDVSRHGYGDSFMHVVMQCKGSSCTYHRTVHCRQEYNKHTWH
eukprot:641278-Karenia_brevis.AAC.1